jgi:glycerol-3-phosphate dehydrogenase
MSRRHSVIVSDDDVISITGGKLTTYRKMAEDVVDALAHHQPKLGIKRSRTANLRLRGAPARSGDKGGTNDHLFSRYGTEANAVLECAAGRPELMDTPIAGLPYLGAEFVYAARAEMAQTLDDVLDRRTRSSIQRAHASIDSARAIAELVAPELGWDEATIDAQVRATVGRITEELTIAGVDRSVEAEEAR